MAPVDCVGKESGGCGRKQECVTIRVWEQINQAVNQVIDNITLADMAEWQRESGCGDFV